MSFDGKTYTADYQDVDYYPSGSTAPHQNYTLFLPDSSRFPQPSAGYPVVVANWQISYTASTAAATHTLDGNTEHALYALLELGIAVALVSLPGAWASAGVQTTGTTPGKGIWHPPGKVTSSDGGWDPTNSDAWSEDNKPNAVKALCWAIQHLRANATTYGLGATQEYMGLTGVMGTSGAGNLGSASCTIAALVALMPDQADADATDHRSQSTRVAACWVADAQLDWTAFDTTTTGLAAGNPNFMVFPDSGGDISSDLADSYADVPDGYLQAFSALWVGFNDQRARDRNATGVAFFLYAAGFPSVTTGLNSSTPYVGADGPNTGKMPNWETTGAGPMDPTDADDKHSGAFENVLMERLLEIETGGWHTAYSRLVMDAGSKSTMGLLNGIDESIIETVTYEATDFHSRAQEESAWFKSIFDLATDAVSAVDSTKLTAVNEILRATHGPGSAVTALGQTAAATSAEAILDRENESIQNRGWFFNVERAIELFPGADGHVVLPTNTLKCALTRSYRGASKITARNGRLYDLEDRTYVLTSSVRVDLTMLLPIDQLPVEARDYVVAAAARVYQAQALGDRLLSAELRDEESRKLVALMQADTEAGNYNAFGAGRPLRRGNDAINPLNVTGR